VSEKVLEELKAVVALDKLPHLIDGMDVSTFQGDEAVGVVVSFHQGKPYKKGIANSSFARLTTPTTMRCSEKSCNDT